MTPRITGPCSRSALSFSAGRREIGPALRVRRDQRGGQWRFRASARTTLGRPRRSVLAGRRTYGGLQTVGTAVGEAGWSLAGTTDHTNAPCTDTYQALIREFPPRRPERESQLARGTCAHRT